MWDGKALASVSDYEDRYGDVDPSDRPRVATLLEDASALLLSAYERAFGAAYEEGAHPAFDRACAPVACRLVNGAVSAPEAFRGATQLTQGAGGYSASVTYGGAVGDMWLGKSDYDLLGLSSQALRVIMPEVAE